MGNEWDWLDWVLGWFERLVCRLFDRNYSKRKRQIEEVGDEEVVV